MYGKNPTCEVISVKQDMVLGDVTATEPMVLFDEESNDGNKSLSQATHVDETMCEPETRRDANEAPPIPDHLRVTFQTADLCETGEQKNKIEHLLNQFSPVFSVDEYDLSLTNITEHVIETGYAHPIKQPPRRVPMAFAGEDKEAIDKLWKQGSIRPSTSPWASPIVLVRKKDGKVRTCVDYRRLNSVTTKDAFPIPRVQDCLDSVAGAVLFSTMDITAAYDQIPMRVEDIPKTAFCSRQGLMEFVTMPFGLATATATIQRTMEIALAGLQWYSCLIYLDGSSFDEHISRLEVVL